MQKQDECWVKVAVREGQEELIRLQKEQQKSPEERLREVEEVLVSLGCPVEEAEETVKGCSDTLRVHRGRKTRKQQEAVAAFFRKTEPRQEGELKERYQPC